MKIIKLLGYLLVFLVIYSLIGTLIDKVVNNNYNSITYPIRRLIQLALFCIFLAFAIEKSNVELRFTFNLKWFVISMMVLVSFLYLYQNTIDVWIHMRRPVTTRESEITELLKVPLAIFIQTCITAPIFEEVLVRGILYEIVKDKMPVSISILVCSLFFSVLHFDNVNTLFYVMIGIILSMIYVSTGSILYCILLHMGINMYALASYYFNLVEIPKFNPILIAITSCIAILSIIYSIKENILVKG